MNASDLPTTVMPVASKTGRTHLLDLDTDQLKTWLVENGEKPYRAQQIFSGIYARGIRQFDHMTDLSKSLRQKLADQF